MSARIQRGSAGLSADDSEREENDPYGVIPDGFLEAYDAETIPEALAKAEQAPSTTPQPDMGRCPDCQSVRIVHKPGYEMSHKRSGDWHCTGCGEHFDEPASDPQTTLEAWQ